MNLELSVELGVKRSSCLVSYTIIIIILLFQDMQ